MKKLIPLLISLILVSACGQKINLEKEKEKLLKTDIAFSEKSIKVGNHQAFLDYASPDVVLLKPNSYPIIGKRALKDFYAEISDTSYRLTWKPSFAKISKSADLGYTFGTYLLEITKGEQKGQISRGTYCTIWEKNAKDEWRFVLDTGNTGLGDQK